MKVQQRWDQRLWGKHLNFSLTLNSLFTEKNSLVTLVLQFELIKNFLNLVLVPPTMGFLRMCDGCRDPSGGSLASDGAGGARHGAAGGKLCWVSEAEKTATYSETNTQRVFSPDPTRCWRVKPPGPVWMFPTHCRNVWRSFQLHGHLAARRWKYLLNYCQELNLFSASNFSVSSRNKSFYLKALHQIRKTSPAAELICVSIKRRLDSGPSAKRIPTEKLTKHGAWWQRRTSGWEMMAEAETDAVRGKHDKRDRLSCFSWRTWTLG